MANFFLAEPTVLTRPTSPPASLVSYIFIRVKELEEFLHDLDEEIDVFWRRVNRPGFTDISWRDRKLRRFGRLSLYWERKWNDLAYLLTQHGLLQKDYKEVTEFKRMRTHVILTPFEAECEKRAFPSPRHLALQYEAEKALGVASTPAPQPYTGGTELKRCSNDSSQDSLEGENIPALPTLGYGWGRFTTPLKTIRLRQPALVRPTAVKRRSTNLEGFLGCIVA